MIDLLLLRIPFKSEYVTEVSSHASEGGKHGQFIDLMQISQLSGCKLSSRNIEFCVDGDLSVSELNHPFESLPSSFASLAMKIHAGNTFLTPCVEIKASPAKLLQVHNVFGSTDLELCALEMLTGLAMAMPDLYELLDVNHTRLDWIDVTFSAHVSNETLARQAIDALRNVTNGQTKPSKYNREYATTVEWNTKSKLRSLKVYLKGQELQYQLKNLNEKLNKKPNDKLLNYKFNILSDKKLFDFAQKCIRFEARLKQNYLEQFGIPRNLFNAISYQKTYEKNGKNLMIALWQKAFSELLNAIKTQGETMKIYTDNEIKNQLKAHFFTTTPKGNISYSKAERLHGFYRRLLNEGYKNVYNSMAKATFYRLLNELISIGLTKAQLQNLHGNQTNVVPLIRAIEIDFSLQRPDWYVEPQSFYANLNNFYIVA